MAHQWIHGFSRTPICLFARAGVFSSNPGGQMPEGLGAILLFSLLGAFFGLLAGIMLVHVIRFVSLLFGRNLVGYSWAVVGAVVGAVLFAWMAAVSEDE